MGFQGISFLDEDKIKETLINNIQKTKIMVSGSITSWQIVGETVETVADFFGGGLQNHCRWWLQPWNKKTLTAWKKVVTKLDSILKSRDITLPTKVCLVKAMVFPVVMYGFEVWTIRKAAHWRIYVFELWCWIRLLKSLRLQGDPTSPS